MLGLATRSSYGSPSFRRLALVSRAKTWKSLSKLLWNEWLDFLSNVNWWEGKTFLMHLKLGLEGSVYSTCKQEILISPSKAVLSALYLTGRERDRWVM